MSEPERIGIIGGSGLYDMEILANKQWIDIDTPFGKPSDQLLCANLGEKEVVFLPRHGRKHNISPSEINYRANIFAMKSLGVGQIISVAACGSLRKDFKPLEFVIPTQFVDRTNQARKQSFFEQGIVAHVAFAHPICLDLARHIHTSARQESATTHFGATYLSMEGPQFSTFAESTLYQKWGMDIIGMTNITEARLAREAEMCYATLASITDYDCWHQTEKEVSVDIILYNLKHNVENAKKILKKTIATLPQRRQCTCRKALEYAIVTPPEAIPETVKQKLKAIIGKYIP